MRGVREIMEEEEEEPGRAKQVGKGRYRVRDNEGRRGRGTRES